MKPSNRPLLALATGLLLASSTLSAHALEISSGAKDTSADTFNKVSTLTDMRLNQLKMMLNTETTERISNDDLIQQDTEQLTAVFKTLEPRIAKLEADLIPLQAKIANFPIEITAQMNQLRVLVADARTELNRKMATLNSRIAQTDARVQTANANLANLNTSVNAIYNHINSLYSQLGIINNRLANLDNLTAYLQAELARLAACMANGSCVGGGGTPHIETAEFHVDGGWDWGLQTKHTYTGLSVTDWPYCAVKANTNMGGRDFNVYNDGGQWVLSTENDNAMFGDEAGTLTALCMRVVK